MASDLILVNGLPGSGKTTLARGLASHLGASFLSQDELKESLQTATPEAAALEPLSAVAMKAVWTLAQGFPGMVIIDSWWFKPRDLESARDGIAASGCARSLEIWCDVPPELARERYVDRSRPEFYQDVQHMETEWAEWIADAEPLGLTPVLRVDTSAEVPINALVSLVETHFPRSP